MVGVVGSGSFSTVSVDLGESSVRPSDDTLILVMEVGNALPLLDLRLVRNLVGESSRGFFASASGSSPVAPPVTPMLSALVFTTAGALDRQLPVPPSHFFPLGVWVPAVEGVDAPFDSVVDDSAVFVSLGVLCGASASLSAVDALGVVSWVASGGTGAPVLVPSAGAWGFGLLFLRGLIRAGSEMELNRR